MKACPILLPPSDCSWPDTKASESIQLNGHPGWFGSGEVFPCSIAFDVHRAVAINVLESCWQWTEPKPARCYVGVCPKVIMILIALGRRAPDVEKVDLAYIALVFGKSA